jgi:hypothetical protein
MTIETNPHASRLWKELRWWLLSSSILTVVATVCVAFIFNLLEWGGIAILIGLGALPFAGEAWIQFRSWWRRVLWIVSGITIGYLILQVFPGLALDSPVTGMFAVWPDCVRGPLTFLFPAILEFVAAAGIRRRPWAWLIVTPALFGLAVYWMEPVSRVAEASLSIVRSHLPVTAAITFGFEAGAAIFGTVLFTRSLTGLLIASRKPNPLGVATPCSPAH